jgi:lysophospholipase L1-like esterase
MMKKFILFLVILSLGFISNAQTKSFLRADTVVVQKSGGNAELAIENGSRGVQNGILSNKYNGRTEFRRLTKDDIQEYSLYADTVTVYNMNTSSLPANNGWVQGSTYATNNTESLVSDGIQMTSAYNGAYNTNNMIRSNFESCLDDIEVIAKLRIVSLSSAPIIGFYLKGATDLFSNSNQYSGFDLTNGNLSASWYNLSYQLRANTGLNYKVGDTVTIIYRRFFHFMYHTVINNTQRKQFTWYDNGANIGGTSWVIDTYPGLYIQGGSFVLQSFKVLGHGYKPDLLVTGSSVIQTQSAGVNYDSAAIKRANDLTGLKIVGAAKAANKLQDVIQCLPEIRAMKPKMVAIEVGHNNLLAGETVAAFGPLYHTLVDSLLMAGITPVCIRPCPTTWVDITQINNFIDSAFGHNPNVKIINLYNTTPLYNTAFPSNKDPQYYIDLSHLNASGARELGKGLASEIKNLVLNKQSEWMVNSGDSSYVLPFSIYKIKLKGTLTANRTLTIPPAASNPYAVLTIADFNSGGFGWIVNQAIRKSDGTTITNLTNGKNYQISVVDGEYFLEREQ